MAANEAFHETRPVEREVPYARNPSFLFALKDVDSFIVCDSFGDIECGSEGLFRNDTRVLSQFSVRIGGARPTLLGTARSSDNVFLTSHLVNDPLTPLGGHYTPGSVVHIRRSKLLWHGTLYERVTCMNYGDREASLPFAFRIGADFVDMFEVRGSERKKRGRLCPPQIADDVLTLRYDGLDGQERSTAIAFSEKPQRLTADEAFFSIALPPGAKKELYIEISEKASRKPDRSRFRHAAASARWGMRKRLRRGARPTTSGRLFNEWLERSRADLALLTTELPTGPFPYAGIPWFSTPFGRDAIITALQNLWLDPSLAQGVLSYLARTQAKDSSSFKDSAPGKIMHETRKGEMTALGELPFGLYYGGIDTTPLFIMLAGAYADRTGQLDLIDPLWPSLVAALAWIEHVIDNEGEGLLVYHRAAGTGLVNQGWKDSEDSVFHADGRRATEPVGLVEVQGYAFAAFRAMARLAEKRGWQQTAARWRMRAEELRVRVEQQFWIEDKGFYGIAVDGEGLCAVRASNPGHLLYVGLPSPERAQRLIAGLSSAAFDSGWGIRTLAMGETHFNPMSYHNGSVWPHDTALAAAGFARYGASDAVVQLMSEMFEAAVNFDMQLPELFCGFPRAAGEPPIAYPVACMPQAWAAGSAFMMLQACLGVRIDGWKGQVHIERARLPIGVDRLMLRDLAVGRHRLNLEFERLGDHVVVTPAQGEDEPISVVVHA